MKEQNENNIMYRYMKTAYEEYFSKLNSLYFTVFGTKPTVPYLEAYNKEMLIGVPNEDGEIQWAPKEQQNEFDWNNLEKEFGFTLCRELKEYYNTFYFLSLSGMLKFYELHFYRIDGTEPLDSIAFRNYKDGQHVFPCTECFLIGNASINDDDSFFIYYDNSTGKVFCYESETKKEFLLSYSLAEIIENMEAIL